MSPHPELDVPVALQPACDVALSELADLFTRCYSNYFVPITMDSSALSWLLTTQTIDLASSVVCRVDNKPAGFAFISARGLSQRLSAMGVLPEYRGRGLGQMMVTGCIERAQEMGVHRMVLEVIDENAHALSIYKQLGFEVRRFLVGYQRPAMPKPEGDVLPHEIDPRELAKAVVHEAPSGLPWQISADSLFALRPPSRAYTLERSVYAAVSHITDDTLRLDAILVPRTKRRKGWGTRMLAALNRLYPGREWAIPAIIPEDLGAEFFIANGFRRQPLRQFEMVLRLDETTSRYPYEA